MFEVIPAIDLQGGRCVRLIQGDFARATVYGDDPPGIARRWEAAGASRIHVVDLDGARAGGPRQLGIVAEIARAVAVPVQLGGGMRTLDDLEAAVDAGVGRIIIGTRAIEDPGFVDEALGRFGERIGVGIDARDGRVAVRYVDGNPNGSLRDIAGVTSEDGRVVGLMPHPEHAVEDLTGPSTDGLGFFTSVLKAVVSA